MDLFKGKWSNLKKLVVAIIVTVIASWIIDSEPTVAYLIRSWLGSPALSVVINEVESQDDKGGDWVELYNPGPEPADVGGFGFRDNRAEHEIYIIPANTVIPAGGFFVLEQVEFGFGLGDPDTATLFAWGGRVEVDSHTWETHAATTYGRCPDGKDGFVTTSKATKGAANDCDGES